MAHTVHLAVYDSLADWEAGLAVAAVNDPQFQRAPGRYAVRTVGPTTRPVVTMGGVRIAPDLALADLPAADSAMLVLPGAHAWDEGERLAGFADAARAFLTAGVPVAAICGATGGLARAGLLDDRAHTSNAPAYLAATGYAGADRYVDAPAVTDGPLITAGSMHPVAFAREIAAALELFTPAVLEAWHGLYATGEPEWFDRLMAAAA
jgi:putative intracellular protease/amidase